MSRPLLITDCDEVLLHMVRPFGEWLDADHDIRFAPTGAEFTNTLHYKTSGAPVERETIWTLLDQFFLTQMSRQTLIPHAQNTLSALSTRADIVVLTNLTDAFNAARVEQLKTFDIHHRVITNQGGKGAPVRRLIDEFRPTAAVFVDDLAHHHESVAEHAPEVYRIHMIGEPTLAPLVPPAAHAHIRIDCWSQAHDWIIDRFEGVPL